MTGFDVDQDGDASTLERLFPQIPVEAGVEVTQDLQYDVGKVGGSTLNTDELGNSTFLSVEGDSMQDAVLLAFGTFGAGSTPTINLNPAFTGANIFTEIGTEADPPTLGSIVAALPLSIQIRTNLGTLVGDVNLDGLVNAADAAAMFTNFGMGTGFLWQEGDLNGDKKVDALDATIMFSSWTLPDPGPFSAALIPEPTSLALASLGLCSVLAIRRRENQA